MIAKPVGDVVSKSISAERAIYGLSHPLTDIYSCVIIRNFFHGFAAVTRIIHLSLVGIQLRICYTPTGCCGLCAWLWSNCDPTGYVTISNEDSASNTVNVLINISALSTGNEVLLEA